MTNVKACIYNSTVQTLTPVDVQLDRTRLTKIINNEVNIWPAKNTTCYVSDMYVQVKVQSVQTYT